MRGDKFSGGFHRKTLYFCIFYTITREFLSKKRTSSIGAQLIHKSNLVLPKIRGGGMLRMATRPFYAKNADPFKIPYNRIGSVFFNSSPVIASRASSKSI